jgi:hypothetical protein
MGQLKSIARTPQGWAASAIITVEGDDTLLCDVCQQPIKVGAYFHGSFFGCEVSVCLNCLETALNRLKEELNAT